MRNLYQPSSHQEHQFQQQFVPNYAQNNSYQHSLTDISLNESCISNYSQQSAPSTHQYQLQQQTQSPKQLIKHFNQMNSSQIKVQSNLNDFNQHTNTSNNKFRPVVTINNSNTLNYMSRSNAGANTNSNTTNNSYLISPSASSVSLSMSSSTSSPYTFSNSQLQSLMSQQEPIKHKLHKLSSASSISSSSSVSFPNNNSAAFVDSYQNHQSLMNDFSSENKMPPPPPSSIPPPPPDTSIYANVNSNCRPSIHRPQPQSNPKLPKSSIPINLHNSIVSSTSTSPNPSSSSSSSSASSPVLKANAKIANDEQNERFFESNTLYKKELKQKQRDFIPYTNSKESSSLISNKSPVQLAIVNQASSVRVPNSPQQAQPLTQLVINNELDAHNSLNESSTSTRASFGAEKKLVQTLPSNISPSIVSQSQHSSSNKVLNIFTNLLNRNKSSTSNQESPAGSKLSTGAENYLNVKNLKRATSSTHFSKVKSSPTNNSDSANSKLFNPASIFNGNKTKPNVNSASQDNQKITNLGLMKTSNKYRRSYDDVSKLAVLNETPQQQMVKSQFKNSYIKEENLAASGNQDSIINLDSNRYENTAFSTKNNGLIFMPSPKSRSPSPKQIVVAHQPKYRGSLLLLEPSSEARTTFDNSNYAVMSSSLSQTKASPNYEMINENRNETESGNKQKKQFKSPPSPSASLSSSSSSASSSSSSTHSSKQPVQLAIIDLSKPSAHLTSPSTNITTNQLKPSDEILKRLNTLTSGSMSSLNQSNISYSGQNDQNAFDNVVYSYVDNLRQHSKRLSEINLLNQSSAAATAATMASIVNSKPPPLPPPSSSSLEHKTSPSSSFSSSSSSSSSSSKVSLASPQLAAAANAVQLQLKSSNSFSSQISSSESKPIISSSSSISSSFHSSISPKSITSSETVIINNLTPSNDETHQGIASPSLNLNVLNLRDKFEQFSSPKRNSKHLLDFSLSKLSGSSNKLNENLSKSSMENISISNSESFSKSQPPQTLPIVYQTNLSSSKQNKLSGSSKELVISTSISPNNLTKAQLNSPTPSSASSASSTSSSSVALINDTSISALPAQQGHESASISSSSSSTNSTYELVEPLVEDLAKTNAKNKSRDVEFKFFYEFYYKLKRPSLNDAIYENDSTDDRPYTLNLNENYFNMGYNDTIRLLIANYIKNSSYGIVEHLLDPILVDLSSANENLIHHVSAGSANFYYKFTIDFYKTIVSNRLNLVSSSKSTNNYISGLNKANFELDYKLANSADLSLLNGSEFNLSIVKDLFGSVDCFVGSGSNGVGMDDSFILIKNKLKSLLIKRMSYLNEQLEISSKSVELNNKLGNKIQRQLEQNPNVTSIELDKYKLLVNESDVITNLLLKLCNKMANTENLIQFKQMKLHKLSKSGQNCVLNKTTNEELDLLKQELNQIQRKKDEAIFLKNGIDKRAVNVANFLNSYLSKDELDEFDLFMSMKCVNSLQVRHIKDHIELTQLQIKLLDEFSLIMAQQKTSNVDDNNSIDLSDS